MITCPNCGWQHIGKHYAAEIDDIRMPRREADVVLRLRQAAGALVSKGQLIDFIYGDRIDGGPDTADKIVETHISRARNKIEQAGWTIEVERFRGYRLVRVER